MKFLIILILGLCAVASAQENLISTSPDGLFRVVAGDNANAEHGFVIVDTKSRNVIFTDDDGSPFAEKALWSPNSKFVIISIPQKHIGSFYTFLYWDGKAFQAADVPDDAIPIKWTSDNTIICSIRAEAKLSFDANSHKFTQKPISTTKAK